MRDSGGTRDVGCQFAGETSTARGKARRLRERLKDIVEPDYYMLVIMVREHVLTDQQLQKILAEPTIHKMNRKLLVYLLDSYTGDFNNVLEILSKAGQTHVVNLIRADGGTLVLAFCISYSRMKVCRYCNDVTLCVMPSWFIF